MKQQYNAALYLRLSRDDELKGESGSIGTQRDILTQYCKEQNLRIVDEYVDDGWSGTNFDRPSFQRMIDDIEDGKINCVITKDLSRLGRNYILTGQYTDIYFPSKGVHIFSGLLKCADCGHGMSFSHSKKSEKRNERKYYVCGTYKEFGKDRCSRHSINYNALYAVVLGRLQYWISQAHEKDDSELLQRLLKRGDKQRTSEKANAKKELSKTEKRLREIDDLFAKMYEDRTKGKITERNFSMLSTKYQEEQIQLEEKRDLLREKLDKSARDSDGAEKWLALVRKYTELTELNAVLLNELIEKILVHEVVKGENRETVQEIEIYYRFVGKIE